MAARITEVRNAVAAAINAAWVSRESVNDEVVTLSRVTIDSATHAGRKVYVFRSAYAEVPVTRDEDQGDYTIAVMVVERYAGQGHPPESWVDARVDWCEWLVNLLGDARGPRLLAVEGQPDSGLWPEVAEVTTVHDLEELTEKKLFVSVLNVTYREHSED